MLSTLAVVLLATQFAIGLPQGTNPIPERGDNDEMGGIFGIGASIVNNGPQASIMLGLMTPGSETPLVKSPPADSDGSGPYKAHMFEDPDIPNHTLYAPKAPPAGIKMPVMVFGNGGCVNIGSSLQSLLTEIASHGYLVIANGPIGNISAMGFPSGGLPKLPDLMAMLQGMRKTSTAKVKQQKDAIAWVTGGGGTKYGDIDKDKIVASGQSCGGLEAYSTSYHDPRVKLTMIFNVGVFDESRRYLISELKAPIGWFVGGPKDGGYDFVSLNLYIAILTIPGP
jgi:dienelactone hydrolase